MPRSGVEIRWATPDDIRSHFGSVPSTMRALVGIEDGKVIGIGGLAYERDGMVKTFLDLTPEARARPVSIMRAARKLIAMVKASNVEVMFAMKSASEPTADRFLRRLGFEPFDEGSEVYVWRR